MYLSNTQKLTEPQCAKWWGANYEKLQIRLYVSTALVLFYFKMAALKLICLWAATTADFYNATTLTVTTFIRTISRISNFAKWKSPPIYTAQKKFTNIKMQGCQIKTSFKLWRYGFFAFLSYPSTSLMKTASYFCPNGKGALYLFLLFKLRSKIIWITFRLMGV